MTLKVTILGCGSSGGVPRPALGWGDCDPTNPRNRRRRTSLLVERRHSPPRWSAAERGRGTAQRAVEGAPAEAPSEPRLRHAAHGPPPPQSGAGLAGVTRVLIDTSPDLREQLIDAEVDWLDGVLYTHEHADHTHGIDDLRALFMKRRRPLDVYLDDHTAKVMRERFAYCFRSPPGSEYPPIVQEHRLVAGEKVIIQGQGGPVAALPLRQDHGDISSLGFRIGNLGYSCDLSSLPHESAAALANLDVWIVDALRYRPHPSHFSLNDALAWIERLKPRHAILTNLHSDLDYETLRKQVPPRVEPAYDGMTFEVADPNEARR